MKDIYALSPINGTAASVTGQAGCAEDAKLTAEQERENLKAQVIRWQAEIKTLTPNSPARRKLGKKMAEMNLRISELKTVRYTQGIDSYILSLVKETTPRPQWKKLVEEAAARMAKDQGR